VHAAALQPRRTFVAESRFDDALQRVGGRTNGVEMFLRSGHRSGWRLRRKDREVRIDTSATLYVNNIFAVRGAAVAGLGIAQLPRIVEADAERAGTGADSRSVTGSWGCAVRRRFIAQAETAVILPFRLQSRHLQLRLKIDRTALCVAHPQDPVTLRRRW